MKEDEIQDIVAKLRREREKLYEEVKQSISDFSTIDVSSITDPVLRKLILVINGHSTSLASRFSKDNLLRGARSTFDPDEYFTKDKTTMSFRDKLAELDRAQEIGGEENKKTFMSYCREIASSIGNHLEKQVVGSAEGLRDTHVDSMVVSGIDSLNAIAAELATLSPDEEYVVSTKSFNSNASSSNSTNSSKKFKKSIARVLSEVHPTPQTKTQEPDALDDSFTSVTSFVKNLVRNPLEVCKRIFGGKSKKKKDSRTVAGPKARVLRRFAALCTSKIELLEKYHSSANSKLSALELETDPEKRKQLHESYNLTMEALRKIHEDKLSIITELENYILPENIKDFSEVWEKHVKATCAADKTWEDWVLSVLDRFSLFDQELTTTDMHYKIVIKEIDYNSDLTLSSDKLTSVEDMFDYLEQYSVDAELTKVNSVLQDPNPANADAQATDILNILKNINEKHSSSMKVLDRATDQLGSYPELYESRKRDGMSYDKFLGNMSKKHVAETKKVEELKVRVASYYGKKADIKAKESKSRISEALRKLSAVITKVDELHAAYLSAKKQGQIGKEVILPLQKELAIMPERYAELVRLNKELLHDKEQFEGLCRSEMTTLTDLQKAVAAKIEDIKRELSILEDDVFLRLFNAIEGRDDKAVSRCISDPEIARSSESRNIEWFIVYSSEVGNIDAFSKLSTQFPDKVSKHIQEQSLLAAIATGQKDMVSWLLSREEFKSLLDYKDTSQAGLLHKAVLANPKERAAQTVGLLLDAGVMDKENANGKSAFELAAKYPEVATMFTNDLSFVTPTDKFTPRDVFTTIPEVKLEEPPEVKTTSYVPGWGDRDKKHLDARRSLYRIAAYKFAVLGAMAKALSNIESKTAEPGMKIHFLSFTIDASSSQDDISKAKDLLAAKKEQLEDNYARELSIILDEKLDTPKRANSLEQWREERIDPLRRELDNSFRVLSHK